MKFTKEEKTLLMMSLLERSEFCEECADKSAEAGMLDSTAKWIKKRNDAKALYWKIASIETI